MVARASYSYPVVTGYIIGIRRRFGYCSIYLHLVLNYMAKKSTETILVLVIAGIVLYFVLRQKYLLTIALILGLIGIFIPFLADKIHWIWTKLGHGLGYITGRIILIVIFFLLLYPLSLAARLFRKKDVVKMKQSTGSYFKERNFAYTKESMENTW